MYRKLAELTSHDYVSSDYPALASQTALWAATKPLAGLKILDATPIFRNTTLKYAALLAAGAELTVSDGNGILPSDQEVIRTLREFGIKYTTLEEAESGLFDIVLDCGGIHRKVSSKFGYCELTRSGAHHYQNSAQVVYLADSGRVKVIETALGTGDGFCRAMKYLQHDDLANRSFVVFGFGKVGCGITLRLLECGAKVTVIEAAEKLSHISCCQAVAASDRNAVNQALSEAWCAVSATGLAGVVGKSADFDTFLNGPLLLANMGVEDEFGPAIPTERVLNNKQPLNFILPEPTLLKYIDPTLALHNLGAVELLSGQLPPGINEPTHETESEIIQNIIQNGSIGSEIEKVNKIYGKNFLEV